MTNQFGHNSPPVCLTKPCCSSPSKVTKDGQFRNTREETHAEWLLQKQAGRPYYTMLFNHSYHTHTAVRNSLDRSERARWDLQEVNQNEHNTRTCSSVLTSDGPANTVHGCNYTRRNCRKAFNMENNLSKQIRVPSEAHEWLLNKTKELQGMQPISRVTLGDVVLDVIRAVDDYDYRSE